MKASAVGAVINAVHGQHDRLDGLSIDSKVSVHQAWKLGQENRVVPQALSEATPFGRHGGVLSLVLRAVRCC